MSSRFLPLIFIATYTLLLTSPIPMHALELVDDQFVAGTPPSGSSSVPMRISADLDGDSSPESLSLVNGNLSILSAGGIAWQSPQDWEVIQAEFTDLNHDGVYEATLLVWRQFRPWPVDRWLPHGGRITSFQDANGFSCQVILVGWHAGRYQEMWAGSPLAEPVKSFTAADLNGDGFQELITLENDYSDARSAPGRNIKVWEWNGFGFSIVNKMEGIYSKMAIVQTNNGRNLILVP